MKKQNAELHAYVMDAMRFGESDVHTRSEIDSLYQRLQALLPNSSKLYKYRSFQGKSFKFTKEALEKGYIWCSRLDQLNDREEGNMNFSLKNEVNKAYRFLFSKGNYIKTIRSICVKLFPKVDFNKISDSEIDYVFNCYTQDGRLIRSRSRDLLVRKGKANVREADRILNYIETNLSKLRKNEETLKKFLEDLLNIKVKLRRKFCVHSFSARYDINSMWAYYANNNQGFCIEYDYSKVPYANLLEKRILTSTYPVVYGQKKRFELHKFLENFIIPDTHNLDELNKDALREYCTKDKSWCNEQEWRIWFAPRGLFDKGYKINVDIVSAIYIDACMYENRKAKSLMSLARKRGWKVFIRYFDEHKLQYTYMPLLRYKKQLREGT